MVLRQVEALFGVFFTVSREPRILHSFPTRRSSDLGGRLRRARGLPPRLRPPHAAHAEGATRVRRALEAVPLGGRVVSLASGGRRAAEDEVAGKHIATLPLAGEARNERPFRTSQEAAMELYEVMRTTFAAREFTDEPVPDAVLFKILDHARYAPNGGNRQGWRVIVVRDPATRKALSDCAAP